MQTIRKLVDNIESMEIKSIVEDFLRNPSLGITDVQPLINIEDSPAAPRKHHFYTGGLLVHTYSVARIALTLSEVFNEVYGLKVNRDIVIATAILHDIYKYYQYAPDNVNGGYKLREDWYLSHDYAIVAELSRRNPHDKLIRALSEVHGQAPFSTIEGLIVHLADSIDARLGEILQNMLISKLREYEKNCAIYKVLDVLIKKHGVNRIISLTLENSDELKKLFEQECKSMTQ
ncbi:MAG: HD domain-containing protein [Desulfurococcaceae archaeon]